MERRMFREAKPVIELGKGNIVYPTYASQEPWDVGSTYIYTKYNSEGEIDPL